MPRSSGSVAVLAVALAAGVAILTTAARPSAQLRNAAASQTPTATTGLGAISGVVTDAVTGRPLAGAIVTLTSMGRGRSAAYRPQATDGQGRFIFTDLPPSDYLMSSSCVGYVDSSFSGLSSPRDVTRITLAAGQWLSNLRFELARPISIGGTVADETGEPVVGAYVRALTRVFVGGNVHLASSVVTRTNDRGAYRIAGLSPGKYIVMVPSVQWAVPVAATDQDLITAPVRPAVELTGSAPLARRADPAVPVGDRTRWIINRYLPAPPARDGVLSAYPITFYPAARTLTAATAVELKAGEDRAGIDIRMAPVQTSRVSGVVQAVPGVDVKGMLLRLMQTELEDLGNGGETATALVDADGSFTFVNVPAGDYTIVASSSRMEYTWGSRTGTVASTMPSPPGTPAGTDGGGTINSDVPGLEYNFSNARVSAPFSIRTPIVVANTNVSDLVVRLKPTASISGRIVHETRAARPGPPYDSVQVAPADGEPLLAMPGEFATVSSGDLTFRIQGLHDGRYVLQVPGGIVKSITWAGQDYTYRAFDVSPRRDYSDVLVTVTDSGATLEGSVRDAANTVVLHAAIIVFPAEPEQWRGYGLESPRVSSGSLTNARYVTRLLPAGNYFAIAVDEALRNAAADPRFLELAARQASRVTLTWGDTKKLDLVLKQVK